jgi:hypothetical protein
MLQSQKLGPNQLALLQVSKADQYWCRFMSYLHASCLDESCFFITFDSLIFILKMPTANPRI